MRREEVRMNTERIIELFFLLVIVIIVVLGLIKVVDILSDGNTLSILPLTDLV